VKVEHQFEVSLPPDEAWKVFTDVERIAPSMPGAELLGAEGDAWRGRIQVKVGPVVAQYEGKASFVERDPAARRVVLRAEGRDTKGQGNAKATVTASLSPAPSGTRVAVETDLAITGRLAQIGRGLIADVSAKLLGEFVANLERDLAARAPAAGAAAPTPAPPELAPSPARAEVKPVDLVAVAGAPLLKRIVPIVILAALALLAFLLTR